MDISLAPEIITEIAGLQITNAVLSAMIVVLIILLLAVLLGSRLNIQNPSKRQVLTEMVIGGFYNMSRDILGNTKAQRYFSFIFTFFVFILFANWWGLLPFVPSTGIIHAESHTESSSAQDDHGETTDNKCLSSQTCVYNFNEGEVEDHEHITHLFRAPTTDVSMTLALAVISVLFTNLFAVREKGFLGFIKNYFHSWNPITILVGLIEVVSELGKLISFSFRLFGNIFAGEVLLLVLTSLTFGIATLPFLGLEIFIGFIQAFVFMMLTMVFMSISTQTQSH